MCSEDSLGGLADALAMVGISEPLEDPAVAIDVLGQALHEFGITLGTLNGGSEIFVREVLITRHRFRVPACWPSDQGIHANSMRVRKEVIPPPTRTRFTP